MYTETLQYLLLNFTMFLTLRGELLIQHKNRIVFIINHFTHISIKRIDDVMELIID